MMNTKEVNYQFRQRYSIVHQPNRRDPEKQLGANQVEITDSWTIVFPANAEAVLNNAARDLEDYFLTSMGLCLRVIEEGKGVAAGNRIVYTTDATLPENSYRVTVSDNEIVIVGSNGRMAAQAGYYLEDLMNLCEAPFLDKGEQERRSLFTPRMVHSGYGLDMFPTEHLVNLAHVGMSAILLFVEDVDITPHGYQDFNDICYRANQYGLDVYAYSYLPHKMHPDDEGAEEFYEKQYGHLFDRCPYFKGLIFVGESCEFPSKDPHCCGARHADDIEKYGNMQHPLKDYPGWYPCYDYVDLMNMIKKIVYKRRPDADIVLWSYNWGSVSGEERKALVDKLPKDITLQATYEMHSAIERDGVDHYTTDYTLCSAGPGSYFSTEGQYAKENGLRFYSMTNTGGLTWDIGVVPYLPAPYQWIKRYEGMREAHEKYGLVGTMESHHFGCAANSFISELAKWAFHAPLVDLDETLCKIVARDFGPDNVDTVCEAYRCFSEGIYHLISTVEDQYGGNRVGPSFPYVLFDREDSLVPAAPYAHFGNTICFSLYECDEFGNDLGIGLNVDQPTEKAIRKFDHTIESFRRSADYYARGCDLLLSVMDSVPERKRDNAERIYALAAFIRNTVRTSIGAKEFYKRKCRLLKTHGEERNRMIDEMLEICRAEAENAKETIPLVEFDSRLGYEPSMEYMCDREHIEWKLARLQKVMEQELPSYYE